MQIDPTDDRYEIITDHEGRRKRIVRDGVRVTVGMRFMDSVQRKVAQSGYHFADVAAARPARITTLDGGTGVNSLNRPGFRVFGEMKETGSGDVFDAVAAVSNYNHQVMHDARQVAYDQYTADLQNAYKNPPGLTPVGEGENQVIGQREGDACSLNGFPGTLRRGADGRLRCIPDEGADAAGYSPAVDSQDGLRRRRKQLRDPQGREAGTEEGEAEFEETQNTTERAGFGSANASRDSVSALQKRHKQIMEPIYSEDAQSLANRWRTP